jgi:ribonuclease VapC
MTFVAQMQRDPVRIWSAVARWETFRALCRADNITVVDAELRVADFEAENKIRLVPIAEREAQLAFSAHANFGRNNHPASLNMGDCFAYACAKANDARLLYKGDDFSKTDLA